MEKYKLPPIQKMSDTARRRRALYEITPGADFVQTEFGYFSLDAWKQQGEIEGDHDPWIYDDYIKEKFYLQEEGQFSLHGANWEAAEFYPRFEDKVLEDRGDKQVIQDEYGRHVLVYKKSRTRCARLLLSLMFTINLLAFSRFPCFG